jgi:uncharacterized protein (TIGR02001 family)
MNKLTRVVTIIALALGGMTAANVASADVSYNIGWASEYYYRGVLQKTSSASAGIDLEEGGFYIGAWTADVGDGVEIDGYLGYGIEMENGLSASLGFTGYYYTGEFDDTYEEVNLNLGFGIASVEYSVGEWDGFGADADYWFAALTLESENGFYGTYGTWGDDFDGDYIELGYGTTISEIDFGIAVILSSDEISDQCSPACTGGPSDDPSESEAIVFTIGKTF